jgi:ubiquinone/menaquinone biosynthesis C-methylase UbiE
MSMTSSYAGTELDVFSHAENWKRYVARHIGVYLQGQVLEVGAGIGSATRAFCNGGQQRWVCLEPDPGLSARARSTLGRECLNCEFIAGSLDDLPDGETFNAILYMDVLEHIAGDRLELISASHRLQPGGVICVLAPAHPWLYSEFDKAIGHFRRYTKSAFVAMDLPGLKLERMRYVDCCGLLPSAMNRFILKSPLPTLRQITFWDRVLVPLSRLIDPITVYSAGKSVLAVWRRMD